LWKALLPREIILVLKPSTDPEEGSIKISYRIESVPLIRWVLLKMLSLFGTIGLNGFSITSREFIIRLPELGIPYRVEEIRDGEFIIKLKKE
jgi:hypothetical protein